jgi:hypothetical protein
VFLSISSVMKWRETPTDEMESNTDRWNGEKYRQMKWRETPTDKMERWTLSFSISLQVICLMSFTLIGCRYFQYF